jgi:hypothetical protein
MGKARKNHGFVFMQASKAPNLARLQKNNAIFVCDNSRNQSIKNL